MCGSDEKRGRERQGGSERGDEGEERNAPLKAVGRGGAEEELLISCMVCGRREEKADSGLGGPLWTVHTKGCGSKTMPSWQS